MATKTKTVATAENICGSSAQQKQRGCCFFLTIWTYLEETDATIREGHNRTKNAVGNAFAVPVITR